MSEEQKKELETLKSEIASLKEEKSKLEIENKIKDGINSKWEELMKNKNNSIETTKEEPKKVFVSKYNKNIKEDK